ncbi:MAG: amidohydrolase family protein, partial [Acidobacteria bacterium]|nr:amidohydrolase family protein [Acidobacteriota bacterium]
GMTPMEVLVASTRTAAQACGRADRIGTLEAGKEADLLVVEGDPSQDIKNLRRLRYVMRGGVLRSLDELRPAPASTP